MKMLGGIMTSATHENSTGIKWTEATKATKFAMLQLSARNSLRIELLLNKFTKSPPVWPKKEYDSLYGAACGGI